MEFRAGAAAFAVAGLAASAVDGPPKTPARGGVTAAARPVGSAGGPSAGAPEGRSRRSGLFRRVGDRDGANHARHPGDLVRVVLALLVIVVTAALARTHRVSRFELNVFRLINDLPGFLSGPLWLVMQIGALPAVFVVGVAAVAVRRFRLAGEFVVAGGGVWVLAKIAKEWVGRDRPAHLLHWVHRAVTDGGLGYPSGHAAVSAALATVVAPWLGRTGRRTVWAAALAVGFARIYFGAHLPLDVLGGWAIGWLAGSLAHLALGAPDGGPTTAAITTALTRILGPGLTVAPLSVDARASSPRVVDLPDGRVFAKVVTRLNRDADTTYKLTRWVLFRNVEDEAPFNSPLQAVEHEGFTSAMARAAGVRTPAVRGATHFEHSAVLVTDWIEGGIGLDHLDRVDPAVLRSVWGEVLRLHDAGIAHRDLRAANVMVDADDQAWIIDFGFGDVGSTPRQRAVDIAELLTTTALLVGATDATAAALDALGPHRLADALPLLQPLALSSATRTELRHHPHLLADLRQATAAATGVDEVPLEKLIRFDWTKVAGVAVLAVGVHLLLPMVGELHRSLDAMRHADWPWLAAAAGCSALSYLAAAVAFRGAAPIDLPLGASVALQSASSFANRFVPLGNLGVSIRYLQRHGVDATAAATTMALVAIGGFSVHVPLLVLSGIAVGRSGLPDVHLPDGWILLVVAVAVLVLAGALLAGPFRARAAAAVHAAAGQIRTIVHEPRRAAQLWGGSFGVTSSYIAALACALRAFQPGIPLSHVALAFLAGSAVASAAPTPGGLGAVEAALVAGLTALGVDPASAIAGVLSYRLATFWLPAIPGGITFVALRRRDEL